MKYLFLILFFIASPAYGATYYVDAGATGAADGTSWTDAYTAIQTAFNSRDLAPGDFVAVAGGIYNETVTPGPNDAGSAGNNVTLIVKAGDTVLIDGENSRDHAVDIEQVSYFTVDGFSTDNHRHYNMTSNGGTGNVFRNNIINIDLSSGAGGSGTAHHGGIVIQNDTDPLAENNIITTDIGTSSGSQSDGIVMANSSGVTVRNNYIRIENPASAPHVDCVQIWNTNNIWVYGNYCEQPIHASNQQGIYIEGITAVDLGVWRVYNNVLTGKFGERAITLAEKSATAEMRVYNNTILELATSTGVPYHMDGDNVYFQNNVARTNRGSIVAFFSSGTQTTSRINYNIYKNASGDVIQLGGSQYTWGEWQGFGYDASGLNAEPSLDAEGRPDDSGDPVVDAGTSLATFFSTDKDGVSRPQGASWDMGAYEFESGVSPTVSITASGSPN